MLIHSSLSNLREVNDLVDAGADVFYAGTSNTVLFGNENEIADRRPWSCANFHSLADIKKALEIIHKNAKKI
ncbi:hypothetical protein KAU09_00075 [Candidatus Parcubacteria bacterium]|nr:hypothetical protein [Candidatus Parcubacteria bacterium]